MASNFSLTEWLQTFAFSRNPFETTEADDEAMHSSGFLQQTFIPPDNLDRILGQVTHPKSAIVFAGRGCGKSTTRAMVAHFCLEGTAADEKSRPIEGGPRALPVLHRQFNDLFQYSEDPALLLNAHVFEIIRRGIAALASEFVRRPQEIRGLVGRMNRSRRLELESFVHVHGTYVPLEKHQVFQEILGDELRSRTSEPSIGFRIPHHREESVRPVPSEEEIALLVGARKNTPPIDQLARFAELIDDLDFKALYVLLDGLDELYATADNPEAAAAIVVPLLANLTLMNATPRVAFKVFAPNECRSALLELTRHVRQDRLDVLALNWREDQLIAMLHRRLEECSDAAVSSLDALCDQGLRGQIEHDLVTHSRLVPRYLILLGSHMFSHRSAGTIPWDPQSAYLTSSDLDGAANWLNTHFPVEPVREIAQVSSQLGSSALEEPLHDMSVAERLCLDLPTPLARMYLTYLREIDIQKRIWHLFDLVECCSAYVSLTLIALLRERIREKLPARLSSSGLDFTRTYLRTWTKTLTRLPGLCAAMGVRHLHVARSQRWADQQNRFLSTVADQRNHFAHDGVQPDKQCTDAIEQLHTPLQSFIQGLHYLSQTRLIQVRNLVKRGAQFRHTVTWYHGDAFVLPTFELNFDRPLDSDHLWLIGNNGNDLLADLHPLMIAQSTLGETGEDVLIYQSIKDDQIEYKRFGTGHISATRAERETMRSILGV